MNYIRPKRIYHNPYTGKMSYRIEEVISGSVTLDPAFRCGIRRGTWMDSPFKEIETLPAKLPTDVERFKPLTSYYSEGKTVQIDEKLEWDVAFPILFKEICASIRRSWDSSKFHVVFASSGNDSRIILSAIKKLMLARGNDWLGLGVAIVTNRWEVKPFMKLVQAQGWPSEWVYPYQEGSEGDHFEDALGFEDFWYKTNAPVPLPGNLWYYLIEWLQFYGVLPESQKIQAYCGLWSNETWMHFSAGGLDRWREFYKKRYYYNVLATLPFKVRTEHPLSDLDVLRVLPVIKNADGDKLRRALADWVCPEAKDAPRLTLDDRAHPVSEKLRAYCEKMYRGSWYGKGHKRWYVPKTSEFSVEWAKYGLASLCEHLREKGVDVR